jgi:hypothetical protein
LKDIPTNLGIGGALSYNKNLTIEFINKYSNKQWNWSVLSRKHNFKMELIAKYPDKPWNWLYVSKNPTLTMNMIEKYPDIPWNWFYISNSLNYEERYLAEAHRQLLAIRIQRHWFKARYNPEYKMCRYLFFKRMRETFVENGYDNPLDEDTRKDIGDWLERTEKNIMI